MKKILIIAIIVLLPSMASAATIVPNGDMHGVANVAIPATVRIYALEIAVAELQADNATMKAQLAAQGNVASAGASTAGITNLEARVTALENVTRAMQDFLMHVVRLLTEALNTIKSRS